MKKKLTPEEMAAILPNIKLVLETGRAWEAEHLHYPAGAIIDALLTIEGMAKAEHETDRCGDGFDMNGWQWDWWQRFSYKGKQYTLSGSGYYGGHAFHLGDDQE